MGHVEWIRIRACRPRPAPGEIAHSSDDLGGAAGGGAVAAVQLAAPGRRAHVPVHRVRRRRAWRTARSPSSRIVVYTCTSRSSARPTRWALTQVDETRRADDHDVFGASSSARPRRPAALERARRDGRGATSSPATSRRSVLPAGARILDGDHSRARRPPTRLGVSSTRSSERGGRSGERYAPGDARPAAALVVTTPGALGGEWSASRGGSGTMRRERRPGRSRTPTAQATASPPVLLRARRRARSTTRR